MFRVYVVVGKDPLIRENSKLDDVYILSHDVKNTITERTIR